MARRLTAKPGRCGNKITPAMAEEFAAPLLRLPWRSCLLVAGRCDRSMANSGLPRPEVPAGWTTVVVFVFVKQVRLKKSG